ncbi:MAG: hypothetical protein K0R65_656 [Crocinitomicaceae bacterium]|jgi:hypothetical protein|nr:hypothetical protein [Crocinitomicaceae bacterium]
MALSYNLKNKSKIAALLIVVFGLIFFNHVSKTSDSAALKKAISSIYNDRLIVESYILNLSENMHQMIDLSDQADRDSKKQAIHQVTAQIDSVEKAYLKTELTPIEKKKFEDFRAKQNAITQALAADDFAEIKELSHKSLGILNDLSLIQVSEAKTVMEQTEKLFGSGFISSKFEIGILIIIALLIQVMIFTSESIAPKNFKHN